MLSALLLAALVTTPIATVALFRRVPTTHPVRGAWALVRRATLTVVGTILLAAAAAGVLAGIGATKRNIIAAAVAFAVVSVCWMPFTRAWSARGHVCWASTTFLFISYLAFMLNWTFSSGLGVLGTFGSLVLWWLEVGAALLGCAYLWELCDALGREDWRRRLRRPPPDPQPGTPLPFVSLHVPAHNEPPEMVIQTLGTLVAMDYPNFQVVVVDDNSDDEALWRPVESWCRDHGVTFAHLEDWPGYKSGALNYALRHLTDPRAEVIGVVDSDYQLQPSFLARCAPLFDDPSVAFVQAPQDYRDWERDAFYRRLYYSYRYFFAVSQPSRNERDGAIFAGTMGLIRRAALEDVGGWSEWCITEDA